MPRYFLLIVVLLSCDPIDLGGPNEWTYVRSGLSFFGAYQLVYQHGDWRRIDRPGKLLQIDWRDSPGLRLAMQVERVALLDGQTAVLHLTGPDTMLRTNSERKEGHLRLWLGDSADESFLFEVRGNELMRPFIFFRLPRERPLHFRLKEIMDGDWQQPDRLLERHLVYDGLLENGDTLALQLGAITYSLK